MNSHPSLQEDNAQENTELLQQRDAARDKEQYTDKDRDTLINGYTDAEFERVCCEIWAHTDRSPECHFRTLIDLLLGHYMLGRGGDRRAAEISNLFTFEFIAEGPTRCIPVILTTRASK